MSMVYPRAAPRSAIQNNHRLQPMNSLYFTIHDFTEEIAGR